MTLASITSRGRAPLRRDRVAGDGPTDSAGRPGNDTSSFTRFEFPWNEEIAKRRSNDNALFFSGHFDAKCPWRLDDANLATEGVFDPDLGFARVHYVMGNTSVGNARNAAGKGHETATASLFKSSQSFVAKKKKQSVDGELLNDLTDPLKYVQPVFEYPYDPQSALERHLVRNNVVTGSNLDGAGRLREDETFNFVRTKAATLNDVVDLEAFADYVYNLTPRCQHDVAPMLYLTQAVLGHVLQKEMSFFSAEVRELKNSLLRTKAVLEEVASENKTQKTEAVVDRWRAATKHAAAVSSSKTMENHEVYLLRLADERQAEVVELKEELAKATLKLEGLNSLREDAKRAKRDTEKMKKQLTLTEKKQLDKEKTFKNLAGQKDKLILELKKKVGELSGVSDSTAKISELVNKNAELQRKLDEGEGATVENGEYEKYADAIRVFGDSGAIVVGTKEAPELKRDEVSKNGSATSTPKGGDANANASFISRKQKQSLLLKKLTPPEAARVCQAMGDWSFAGDVLRGTTIDYTSEVLTCGVLDHADIGEILTHLSDMDGIVLFAMLRKTDNTNVTGPMKTVHPSLAAGWIVNAAAQAKKRLAIGESLGVNSLLQIVRTVGDDDAVLVLDSQNPTVLAKLFEKMYLDDQLGDAVELLTRCTGATRIETLFAMDPMIRQDFSDEMNKNDSNGGGDVREEKDLEDEVVELVVPRDSVIAPSEGIAEDGAETFADGAAPKLSSRSSLKLSGGHLDTQMFRKARHERDISDPERSLEHMTIPRAWLEYCECFDGLGDDKTFSPKKMLELWRRESYRVMRPIELRSTLTRIYKMKLTTDSDSLQKQQHRIPLPDYVAHWFHNNFLFKKTARAKLAVFVFSLARIYEDKTDKRACQFVRLCGLFHPMPSVMGDLLLQAMEITASELSGPDELFFAPEDFWNTWTSGKMIGVPTGKQIEILNSVFAEGETFRFVKGAMKKKDGDSSMTTVDLLKRLHAELEETPEFVPDYITLTPGSVSLSKFIEFVLELAMETNVDSHDAVLDAFVVAAGDDKILDFDEFKQACVLMRPISPPPEDSYAFMYWRALRWSAATGANKGASSGEVIKAARHSQDALRLVDKDITKLGVTALAGAESFLWHCGIINQLGVRKDGTSVLLEARSKLRARHALLSTASRSFQVDRGRVVKDTEDKVEAGEE